MSTIRPWRTVVTPHEDIRKGRFDASVFAANLGHVLAGQGAVDYRVDLRVPGIGPNAAYTKQYLPGASDPVLLDVLNGVPPKGATTLRVLGDSSCQAWLLDNKLYLRTQLTIISPAWQSIMTSADGTHAYELQPTSEILVLRKGKDAEFKLVLEGLK